MSLEWILACGFGTCFIILAMFQLAPRLRSMFGGSAAGSPSVVLRPEEDYLLEMATVDEGFRRMIAQCRLGISATTAAIGLAALGMLAAATVFVIIENVWIAIVAGVSVWLVAWLAIALRAQSVRHKVETQLPSLLEMLSGTLRASVSLEQGLESVSAKMTGFLANDLKDCTRKIELGLPTPIALGEIANRYNLLDLRLLVAAVSTHRQTGGDLAGVMDQLSRVARDRLAFRQQLSSLTISARLAAIIVGLAAPALIIYYATRGYGLDRMWDDPSGRFFLLVAMGLESIGVLWVIALTRKVV